MNELEKVIEKAYEKAKWQVGIEAVSGKQKLADREYSQRIVQAIAAALRDAGMIQEWRKTAVDGYPTNIDAEYLCRDNEGTVFIFTLGTYEGKFDDRCFYDIGGLPVDDELTVFWLPITPPNEAKE